MYGHEQDDGDDGKTFQIIPEKFAEEMKAKLVRHAVELFLRPRRSFMMLMVVEMMMMMVMVKMMMKMTLLLVVVVVMRMMMLMVVIGHVMTMMT